MSTHRFFVPADNVTSTHVEFSQEQTRQMVQVLRSRVGDAVVAFDGSGQDMDVELEALRPCAVGRIVATRYTSVEPGVDLHLYQGLLKGTKLEMVLQKGTELGVSAFIPTVTARSVATGASDSRRRRHDAIVREAAEQSGRGRVPRVADPLRFEEAIRHAAGSGQVVLLWEGEASARLCEIPLPERGATIGLFVGPEGGFTKEEAATAGAHGAHVVTLGRRILRAETAGIVGPALVLARLGELG